MTPGFYVRLLPVRTALVRKIVAVLGSHTKSPLRTTSENDEILNVLQCTATGVSESTLVGPDDSQQNAISGGTKNKNCDYHLRIFDPHNDLTWGDLVSCIVSGVRALLSASILDVWIYPA